ncbi:MAG: hypothetical protein IT276_14940 [Ignavibacteriaceae bacterium]|nr:hypothetical protein [Ignavibacteriaceae bacterium]
MNLLEVLSGRVILKKATRYEETQAQELEGIIIGGQYYYLIYYEVEQSELNYDESGYWVSVSYEDIKIISVSRCHVESGDEYEPIYEFETELFREIKKECVNHAEEYLQEELINNHKEAKNGIND